MSLTIYIAKWGTREPFDENEVSMLVQPKYGEDQFNAQEYVSQTSMKKLYIKYFLFSHYRSSKHFLNIFWLV